jgi:hypothetical protein
MSDYHVPDSRCTNCGENIDAANPVNGGRSPQPEDIALCFYCHHLMIYGKEMKLRNLTDEEVVEIAGDSEVVHAMTMLGKFKRWEEGHNAQASTDNRATRRARKPR